MKVIGILLLVEKLGFCVVVVGFISFREGGGELWFVVIVDCVWGYYIVVVLVGL